MHPNWTEEKVEDVPGHEASHRESQELLQPIMNPFYLKLSFTVKKYYNFN